MRFDGKQLKILIILGAITVAIIRVSTLTDSGEKARRFRQMELAGRVESKENIKGVTRVILKGDSSEYWEFLAVSKEEQPRHFYNFLKVCDSIYKAPYGDSVYLYRDGRVYSWRIAK